MEWGYRGLAPYPCRTSGRHAFWWTSGGVGRYQDGSTPLPPFLALLGRSRGRRTTTLPLGSSILHTRFLGSFLLVDVRFRVWQSFWPIHSKTRPAGGLTERGGCKLVANG